MEPARPALSPTQHIVPRRAPRARRPIRVRPALHGLQPQAAPRMVFPTPIIIIIVVGSLSLLLAAPAPLHTSSVRRAINARLLRDIGIRARAAPAARASSLRLRGVRVGVGVPWP